MSGVARQAMGQLIKSSKRGTHVRMRASMGS
jgi:hypothetical protein